MILLDPHNKLWVFYNRQRGLLPSFTAGDSVGYRMRGAILSKPEKPVRTLPDLVSNQLANLISTMRFVVFFKPIENPRI